MYVVYYTSRHEMLKDLETDRNVMESGYSEKMNQWFTVKQEPLL